MKELSQTLYKAIQGRASLSLITNAMRLVNGAGDGLDGLLIDRYHQHLHLQFLTEGWQQQAEEISGLLRSAMPVAYLIIKSRRGLDVKTQVLTGTDPCTIVKENGVKFEVNLNDGINCGLFLDMRHNRRMVGDASKGKKVLNCFSYTCSFGVYARLGGAREVINTDISRKILERGKKNYQLNGLSIGPQEFVHTDSLSFLQRALKKENYFDIIVLDPPSFARYEGKVFQIKRDLPKLISSASAVLNPRGRLLVSANYSEMSHLDLEKILANSLNGRRPKNIQRVGQDKDFRGSNSFKESFLVGLWVELP